MVKPRVILADALNDSEALDKVEKASFVVDCELWTEEFNTMKFKPEVGNRLQHSTVELQLLNPNYLAARII